MKTRLLFIFLFLVQIVQAQTWDEWFEQKKTRKKYLLQQIAALQVYLEYAKEGYTIVGKGLQTIQKIKKGDFDVHFDFFSSLKQVNPWIKNSAKVGDIMAYQLGILKETKLALQRVRESDQFTYDEIEFCKGVFDNLINECLESIEELVAVIMPSGLEMKDDERITRIERLYADMQNRYAFTYSFSHEMSLLCFQRIAEQIEINKSKLVNGK